MSLFEVNKENINNVMVSHKEQLQNITLLLPIKPNFVKTPKMLDLIFNTSKEKDICKPKQILNLDLARLYIAIAFLVTMKSSEEENEETEENEGETFNYISNTFYEKLNLIEDQNKFIEENDLNNNDTTIRILNMYEKFLYNTILTENKYELFELKTNEVIELDECSENQKERLEKISSLQDRTVKQFEKLYLKLK